MSKTKKVFVILLLVVAFMLLFSTKAQAAVDGSMVTDQIKTITFDGVYYLDAYPDLKAAFGSDTTAAYNHYLTYGLSEGRSASLMFDVVYYVNNYSDLKAAFGNDYEAAYVHFIQFGASEGRSGCRIYDSAYYLAQNSDVKAAFGTNYLAVYNHYAVNGVNEGRLAHSSFDVKCYLSKYADLTAAFTATGYKLGFNHYLVYGINEGRVGTHEYTIVTTTPATCTTNGKTVTSCACGLSSKTTVIPATGHTSKVTKTAKAATCTEAGYTQEVSCATCGTVLTKSTTIAALGHNYTSEVTTEPTCVAEGVRTYTCTRCGEQYTETIAATGEHTYEEYVVTEPTCTDAGLSVKECTVCGYAYTEPIPATEHTYGDVVYTLSENCETVTATKTCSVCDEETEGHSVTATANTTMEEVSPADCENNQVIKYTATIELGGETLSYESDEIEVESTASGHSYVTYRTDVSYEYKICTVCGTQEKVAHNYEIDSENPVTWYVGETEVATLDMDALPSEISVVVNQKCSMCAGAPENPILFDIEDEELTYEDEGLTRTYTLTYDDNEYTITQTLGTIVSSLDSKSVTIGNEVEFTVTVTAGNALAGTNALGEIIVNGYTMAETTDYVTCYWYYNGEYKALTSKKSGQSLKYWGYWSEDTTQDFVTIVSGTTTIKFKIVFDGESLNYNEELSIQFAAYSIPDTLIEDNKMVSGWQETMKANYTLIKTDAITITLQ